MAKKHSTRRKAGQPPPGARARKRAFARTDRTSSETLAASRLSRVPAPARAAANVQLASRLYEIARHLRLVYSTCVTAELALQGQNADQDLDIRAALRTHVAEPVSREAEKLTALAFALAGDRRERRL